MISRLLASIAIAAAFALPPAALEFRTEEFRSGSSHIAMAYTCGILGVKTGVAPDAMDVVSMSAAKGLTAKHSGDLMADALDWWDSEGEHLASAGMWDQFCEQPISNLRRLVSR